MLCDEASADDVVIAREAKEFSARAYGGTVAWSSYSTSTRRYRLMIYRDGARIVPRVPAQARPFELDVGPGPSGRPQVVYSRCAKSRSRGCRHDLYIYLPATKREVHLSAASTPGADERRPTVWRNHLAFLRFFPRRDGEAALRPHIYRVDRPRRAREVHSGLPAEPDPLPAIYDLDLSGRRLVFDWEAGIDCGPPGEIDSLVWQLRIAAGTSSRLLDRGCSEGVFPTIQGPTILGTVVSYLRTDWSSGSRTDVFRRISINGEVRSSAAIEESGVAQIATDTGGALWIVRYANDRGDRAPEPWELVRREVA